MCFGEIYIKSHKSEVHLYGFEALYEGRLGDTNEYASMMREGYSKGKRMEGGSEMMGN